MDFDLIGFLFIQKFKSIRNKLSWLEKMHAPKQEESKSMVIIFIY